MLQYPKYTIKKAARAEKTALLWRPITTKKYSLVRWATYSAVGSLTATVCASVLDCYWRLWSSTTAKLVKYSSSVLPTARYTNRVAIKYVPATLLLCCSRSAAPASLHLLCCSCSWSCNPLERVHCETYHV